MCLNGVWLGVFLTLFVEMAVVIVGNVVANVYFYTKKQKKNNRNH